MEGGSVFGRTAASKRLDSPRSLKTTALTANGVTLKWNAIKGAKGYLVLRDGKALAKTTRTSFTDTSVTAGKTYRYSVRAYDASKRAGALSRTLRLTVPKTAPK